MKPKIHPTYQDITVSCACGNSFMVGSTNTELRVELCSACHPFYTGKQKFVDTARRVEKFATRLGKQTAAAAGKVGKTAKRAAVKKVRAAKVGTPTVTSL